MESLRDVTEITFEEFTDDRQKCKRRFSITDPDEVSRLVFLAHPKPWTGGVPMCLHTLQATFKNASGSVAIDFCRICLGADEMPVEFYAEYLRLSRRHKHRLAFLYGTLAVVLALCVFALCSRHHR